MSKDRKYSRKDAHRLKLLYLYSETKAEQDYYAGILEEISFF